MAFGVRFSVPDTALFREVRECVCVQGEKRSARLEALGVCQWQHSGLWPKGPSTRRIPRSEVLLLLLLLLLQLPVNVRMGARVPGGFPSACRR